MSFNLFFRFHLFKLEILDFDNDVKCKPFHTDLRFYFRRTDHSSELRGCTNQQAVHVRPVPAAGRAGAAEAAAAPPSEPLPHTQPIAAPRSRLHLHHLVSLKGSVRQSLTSALQSSGPMPPCSAPPHLHSVSDRGRKVQHQAVTTSDREAVSGQ